MTENKIVGTAILADRKFELTQSVLTLKRMVRGQSSSYELFLEATEGKEDGCIIRLDYMPVARVKKMDDLISARMHFKDTSSCEPDDTLGSDPNELIETSGWFISPEDEEIWHFESMTANFEHLGNKKFLIKIRCSVSNHISDKTVRGQAEFKVEANEEECILPERKPNTPEQVIDGALQLYKTLIMKESFADKSEIIDSLTRESILEIQNKTKLNSQELCISEKLLNKLNLLLKGGPGGHVNVSDYARVYVITDILYNEIVGTISGSKQWSVICSLSHSLREALINYYTTAEELQKTKSNLRQEILNG